MERSPLYVSPSSPHNPTIQGTGVFVWKTQCPSGTIIRPYINIYSQNLCWACMQCSILWSLITYIRHPLTSPLTSVWLKLPPLGGAHVCWSIWCFISCSGNFVLNFMFSSLRSMVIHVMEKVILEVLWLMIVCRFFFYTLPLLCHQAYAVFSVLTNPMFRHMHGSYKT